jgi:hypothetical protein
MMGEPPLLAGVVHATVADAFPADAITVAGAEGTVTACGVTRLLGSENALIPNELLAEISN